MAFRKKADYILTYKPDILVVPECENPDKLKFTGNVSPPTDIVWYGSNRNKGLGVMSYGDFKIRMLDVHDPGIKTILPIEIFDKEYHCILLAVWAFNPLDPGYNYIGQVWKAIEKYGDLLVEPHVIIAGDFNSNVFWDKLKRKITHTMLVEKLTEKNIHSCYHVHTNINQGQEHHPTFYMYRHRDKPYHLDYCFVSGDLMNKLQNVEIGKYDDWHHYSDHCPLFVTLSCK